ncbi:ABC transporter permease [Candidatus Uhrbacteria bacterium]|nr:ABC transporter permease [Candidatus Uhrbacteria bacterium]
MFISSARIIKFSFQNFWRNLWLSTVTVSILTLALLSVNFFVGLHALLEQSIQSLEQRVNVTVYFQETAQDAEIQKFVADLGGIREVLSADLISKDDALNRLKERYQSDSNIQESLKELEENPLTASVIVRAKTIEGYTPILSFIDDQRYQPLIENRTFQDRTRLISRIQEIKAQVRTAGMGVTIFLAIIAALIVMNTIRITIYTRRREVGIMKLVGATNWFVRAPLIIEALLYSVVAMGITILLVFPILSALQPIVFRLFDGNALDMLGYFSENFIPIFGYQFAAVVILNVLSSTVAIGRYLKV